MSYEINWDKVNEDAQASISTSKFGGGEKSIFIKMKAGVHHLRIIPSGNALDQLPYLRVSQHPTRITQQDGNIQFNFTLCWSHAYNNLESFKTSEDKKTKSIISYLGQQKVLDDENFRKYQQHGCPFCKAHQFLNMHGVEQETKRNFYPKEQFLFNVLWRQTQTSGDNEVYIWRVSKTQFNGIINSVRLLKVELNQNPLDVTTGKDIIVQATGELLARRYPLVQFSSVPSPLNLGERTPHDLLNTLVASYRPYQEVVNLLKLAYGKVLAMYGYTIPGDVVITQQYQDTVKMIDTVPAPTPAVLVQHQTELSQKFQESQQFDPSFVSGDKIIEKDGKLYNERTGKFLF